MIHAIEMAFESIDVGGPKAPEGRKPGIDLPERLRPEPVETSLRVDSRLHEVGLTQHPQVLGHRGLRHPESALDLADGLLRGGQ